MFHSLHNNTSEDMLHLRASRFIVVPKAIAGSFISFRWRKRQAIVVMLQPLHLHRLVNTLNAKGVLEVELQLQD